MYTTAAHAVRSARAAAPRARTDQTRRARVVSASAPGVGSAGTSRIASARAARSGSKSADVHVAASSAALPSEKPLARRATGRLSATKPAVHIPTFLRSAAITTSASSARARAFASQPDDAIGCRRCHNNLARGGTRRAAPRGAPNLRLAWCPPHHAASHAAGHAAAMLDDAGDDGEGALGTVAAARAGGTRHARRRPEAHRRAAR